MSRAVDELEQLRLEHQLLEKKLAERRTLMERVWAEKADEDERIRRETHEAEVADVVGHEKMLVAQQELEAQLASIAADDLARRPLPIAPLQPLDPISHHNKMEKLRAREAKRGLVY